MLDEAKDWSIKYMKKFGKHLQKLIEDGYIFFLVFNWSPYKDGCTDSFRSTRKFLRKINIWREIRSLKLTASRHL